MIKILVVDDQELFRESISWLLASQGDFVVVGEACDGNQALELSLRLEPEIVLMDIRMPNIDGLECATKIKELKPDVKIIILTTFDDAEYVYRALKVGVDGFLLKGVPKADLIKAIRQVKDNKVALDPEVARKVFDLFGKITFNSPTPPQHMGQQQGKQKSFDHLTPTEIKIIRRIGQGFSNKEITNQLNFSEGTIRNYVSGLLRKLEVRDRTQLAIYAHMSGLLMESSLKEMETKHQNTKGVKAEKNDKIS